MCFLVFLLILVHGWCTVDTEESHSVHGWDLGKDTEEEEAYVDEEVIPVKVGGVAGQQGDECGHEHQHLLGSCVRNTVVDLLVEGHAYKISLLKKK